MSDTWFQGLRDVPIVDESDDALDLKRYARALGRFVLECDTPITVGIQGDWGSGKTSLMNLVRGWLDRQVSQRVHCVDLNTWQYAQFAGDSELSLVMLRALHGKLARDPAKISKALVGVGSMLRSVRAITVMGSGVELKDIEDVQDFGLEALKKQFEEEVEARLKRDKLHRVVVFIDDLDRVPPVRAVEILEVLKNFVDVPGCVFVLACDYEVVIRGLETKFGISARELNGRSFFDKIIQVPFRMPVARYDVEHFIRHLLDRIQWGDQDRDVETYKALLEHSIHFNPRSVKRLCNTLMLLRNVAEDQVDSGGDGLLTDPRARQLLFALVCMETSYERDFEVLVGAGDAEQLQALLFREFTPDTEETPALIAPAPFIAALRSIICADPGAGPTEEELSWFFDVARLSSMTSVGEQRPTRRRLEMDELLDTIATAAKGGSSAARVAREIAVAVDETPADVPFAVECKSAGYTIRLSDPTNPKRKISFAGVNAPVAELYAYLPYMRTQLERCCPDQETVERLCASHVNWLGRHGLVANSSGKTMVVQLDAIAGDVDRFIEGMVELAREIERSVSAPG